MYNGSVQQRSLSLAEAVRIPYSRRNPSKSLTSLAPLYFSMLILMLWYRSRSRGCELDCAMAVAICETVSCSVRKRSLISLDPRSEDDDEEDEADDEDGGASSLAAGAVVRQHVGMVAGEEPLSVGVATVGSGVGGGGDELWTRGGGGRSPLPPGRGCLVREGLLSST